jgi:putative nucleotidyltransferase with HDIG domain
MPRQDDVDPPPGEHELTVDPADLQAGHFVARLDRPWRDTHFPLEGVLIDGEEDKAWMVEHCRWVVIDRERSRDEPPPVRRRQIEHDLGAPVPAELPARIDAVRQTRIDRHTLDAALSRYDDLDRQARRFIDAFTSGGVLDMPQAEQVVGRLADALEHNMAALVWLTRIKEVDDYTAQHCINVAILAIGLAHGLGWERIDVEHAGLAGLLHDLGKTRVDQQILNKPGPLTGPEFEHIKQHAAFGYEMLRQDRQVPPPVADAARGHHERPDGSGYPLGLGEGQIPSLARVISVVDAYDAITSTRVYDAARSHHEALGILWRQRGRQFDGPMVEAFIRFMGWVTPGTLVRLSTGALAVVVQARGGRGLLPMVRALERTAAGWRMGPDLDLARRKDEGRQPDIRVAEVLPDGTEGVDMRELARAFT